MRLGLVVAANLSQIVGTWMLARAWRRAALALPVSRRSRGLLVAAVVAAALAATVRGMVRNAGLVGQGHVAALTGLASAMGDAVSLFLIGRSS